MNCNFSNIAVLSSVVALFLSVLPPAYSQSVQSPSAVAKPQSSAKSTATNVSPKHTQLTVSSIAFKSGNVVPKKFTGDGADISPPLSWTAVPAKTASIAVQCADPDSPGGLWYHWILFNLPPEKQQLSANLPKAYALPDGSRQLTNDFQHVGYNGPAPPPGSVHHYVFTVFALDTKLNLNEHATKTQFQQAMSSHVLAKGQLVGTYKR
jgi:Raf kinase inhibitor-like YbhB/YbcL family protein